MEAGKSVCIEEAVRLEEIVVLKSKGNIFNSSILYTY